MLGPFVEGARAIERVTSTEGRHYDKMMEIDANSIALVSVTKMK